MASAIHSANSQFDARHQANIVASLTHRLDVARATNNVQLIELLEREKRQVVRETKTRRISQASVSWLETLKQTVDRFFFGSTKLQAMEYVDGYGDRWWYAFDPRTGQCVYADSEAELRLWIENNYQEK